MDAKEKKDSTFEAFTGRSAYVHFWGELIGDVHYFCLMSTYLNTCKILLENVPMSSAIALDTRGIFSEEVPTSIRTYRVNCERTITDQL
jgi:hypothetical protein